MNKLQAKAVKAQVAYDDSQYHLHSRIVRNRELIMTIYRKSWRKAGYSSHHTDKFAWAMAAGNLRILNVTKDGVQIMVTSRRHRYRADDLEEQVEHLIPFEHLSYSVWDYSKLVREDFRRAMAAYHAAEEERAAEELSAAEEGLREATERLNAAREASARLQGVAV